MIQFFAHQEAERIKRAVALWNALCNTIKNAGFEKEGDPYHQLQLILGNIRLDNDETDSTKKVVIAEFLKEWSNILNPEESKKLVKPICYTCLSNVKVNEKCPVCGEPKTEETQSDA